VSDLSPPVRVLTALLPFCVALFIRLVIGNSRLTRSLVSLGVLWFAVNVLMAPYALDVRTGIRSDVRSLRTLLP
jgi:hypothetical protein